ncbi:MAG: ribosome small subunit-dependent GTPase A [Acidimicrobiales bacterium]
MSGSVPVLVTSTVDGRGLAELRTRIGAGRTLALIGASGVGKSSLVNALVGEPVLDVGDVRASDAKGRHTTTARELVRLPGGGLVLDTPGIRAVGLWEAEAALKTVFGDLETLAAGCRFVDCAHDAEPGCAVTAAVEAGDVDPCASIGIGRFGVSSPPSGPGRRPGPDAPKKGPTRPRRCAAALTAPCRSDAQRPVSEAARVRRSTLSLELRGRASTARIASGSL